jgi:hypothetical protein
MDKTTLEFNKKGLQIAVIFICAYSVPFLVIASIGLFITTILGG